MIKIKVRGDNIEGAIRELKRQVKDTGLLIELRRRREYEKPSLTRRKQRINAKLRNKYQIIREKREFY